MKIINAIHAQSMGGVDRVFRDYTEILLSQGHEVSLLISDNSCDDYQNLAVKKIFKLKNRAQICDFLRLVFIIIFYRPDLIICHSRRLMSWAKLLRRIKFIKTKTIAINHGISFHKSLSCDYVVSINDEINQMVVDAGCDREKSFVLKNAIKVDQEYRKKNLKNPPVIGIYGRIEYRKGFDILIKACELLSKQGHDFILKIGGFEIGQNCLNENDVTNWSDIERLIKQAGIEKNYVKFGVVLDKKKFFEDVDIFCVPSREEPFGLVILEAFLNSTLVLSSDTVGGKLMIDDGENGELFENENAQKLAEKIIMILQDRENYNAKTQKAFLRLEKEFSFDSLGQEMSKILSKIRLNG